MSLDTLQSNIGYFFGAVFHLSFPDFTESVKDSAYLGSAKRKILPPQRGQERQQKQCNSKASDNRFSMTSTTLSIDSVYEEEKTQATGTEKIPYKGI